ncbi:MAG: NAD(P)-dependent oxidoreductase [Spirochaetes bacterium]|nr:NAD(P)-dependent oxidoreductase [Spirochaetota bacterium]
MILVTGCNSLLGTRLIKKLAESGEKLRCVDLEKPAELPAGAEFIEGDILDAILLGKLCKGVDVIFHLMDVKSSKHHGRRYMRKINVKGVRMILKAANAAGVKRFIFLSSYEVYGAPKNLPVGEYDLKIMKPVTRYGKDKLKAEKICLEYIKANKMSIAMFRPTPMLGPGTRNPIALITLLMAMGMEDANRIYVSGHGENRFQMLHPEDAATALFMAHKTGVAYGKIYNLGSDDVPTQMEQLTRVKEKAGLDAKIMHLSTSKAKFRSFFLKPFKIDYLNKGHVMYLLTDLILNCEAAKTDLGWQPQYGNVDIILETIEWYRKEKL